MPRPYNSRRTRSRRHKPTHRRKAEHRSASGSVRGRGEPLYSVVVIVVVLQMAELMMVMVLMAEKADQMCLL